jgi:hypothetical protein
MLPDLPVRGLVPVDGHDTLVLVLVLVLDLDLVLVLVLVPAIITSQEAQGGSRQDGSRQGGCRSG